MRYIKKYEARINFFRKKPKEEPVTPVNKTKEEIEAEVEKVLVDRFVNSYRSVTDKIELSHHYLDGHFASNALTYEFNIKSNQIDIIEPTTNIKLVIWYNKDTSNDIIINDINVVIKSEIKWDFDEPHQELNITKSGYTFKIRKGWRLFYAETESRNDVKLYERNPEESSYTFWSAVDNTIKNHFQLIDQYVGLDEHNLRVNKKIEEIKDELDHVKQCLADIEDLSKQTTIKLADKEVKDGKITSKYAIIGCSFEIESLKVYPVSSGVNINFDQKTIQLFDYLTEAKNRIGDIFDGVKFDMDITNGKIIFFINIPL
jgi:hypothetical protein